MNEFRGGKAGGGLELSFLQVTQTNRMQKTKRKIDAPIWEAFIISRIKNMLLTH